MPRPRAGPGAGGCSVPAGAWYRRGSVPRPRSREGRGRSPLAARGRGAGADWLARGVPAAGAPTAPLTRSRRGGSGAERAGRDELRRVSGAGPGGLGDHGGGRAA